MKTFSALNNYGSGGGTNFSKGKIIVLGNSSTTPSSSLSAQSGITAYKSKFATPSFYDPPPHQISTHVFNEKVSQFSNHHDEHEEESSDEEEVDFSNSKYKNVQSTINTTNSSLNTTFSGFYHKLIGREKRRPQCTPPIRTVVSVGFLKEHYEKQVEMEKQKQNNFSSSLQDEPHSMEPVKQPHIDQRKKKPEPERASSKPKVSWEDDQSNTSRKNPIQEQKKDNLTTDSESNWTDMEIDRRPSLGPVMRSVYIRKDSLVSEEENTRTRFVGELDNKRNVDLDWKSRQETNRPRKSNIPLSSRPSSAISRPSNSRINNPSSAQPSSIDSNEMTNETQPSKPVTKQPTQSKRIFIPTKKPTIDKEEEEEFESKHHQIEQPVRAEKKSIVQKNNTPQILDENSMEKHKHIVRWIQHDLDIEFVSNVQCENDLRTGLKFAEIVSRIEGEGKMKGISKLPQTTAAMHNNLERVFSILRDNKTIELRYLWSTKEVISGDYNTIWGILNDIYNAYWKKTSKVKRASQTNKKRDNSRMQSFSQNSSMEEEKNEDDLREGFSIDDINRMKRELLESSYD